MVTDYTGAVTPLPQTNSVLLSDHDIDVLFG